MPELPEMEIVARRLDAVLPGRTVVSVAAPGVNVLRTFDPPLSALVTGEIHRVSRRGKLLLIDLSVAGVDLALVIHLMSAGRVSLRQSAPLLRDRNLRVAVELSEKQFLVLREFGKKQSAWVKLVPTPELKCDDSITKLGPDAWPWFEDTDRLKSPRPLNSLLRDQSVIAGIGRTWVDEILHAAQLSPFRRGVDLSDAELATLQTAITQELGRVITAYEERVVLPLPNKFPKPTRVHAHQGEPCYRCTTTLQAVYFEEYVMTYCPTCQTDGRILKDRRLSKLLK